MFYITMSIGGYVTVFLQSIGFNAQQVGMVTALNSGVGIFSAPFWGMLSDKLRSVKKVIIFLLIAASVFFALIPASSRIIFGGGVSGGISFVFFMIPLAMFFKTPIMSLLENWMLRNSSKEKLNYGALRAFGALSYAIASFILGYVLPSTGVEFTFYANAYLTVPALAIIIFVRGSADDEGLGKKRLTFKEMQIGQLFKNYYLMTYIIFSIFQRIPFQCSMTFLPFLVSDTGGNIEQMGIIMGLRAFVEIPMMLLLKPLRQKVPLYVLIMVACGLFMSECVLYSFANSFGAVVAISVLHGLGNGLMLTCSSSYVFSLTPENLKATSQTILGSMNSVAGILGGLFGGTLILALGIKQFYLIIGIMMVVTLSFFILSFVIGEKVLGIKRPGLSLH
jgi:PPP family 3-phenylpropionic acid transporter